MNSQVRRVCVAGFGNEYREDDAAGLILARRIHAFLNSYAEVEAFLFLQQQLLLFQQYCLESNFLSFFL